MARIGKNVFLPTYPKALTTNASTEERMAQLDSFIKDLLVQLKSVLQKIVRVETIDENTSATLPTLYDFEDGEIKLYSHGTTHRLYVRIAGVLYYVGLTAA